MEAFIECSYHVRPFLNVTTSLMAEGTSSMSQVLMDKLIIFDHLIHFCFCVNEQV